MSVINWIISNVFTQAGIVIALIAMLGIFACGSVKSHRQSHHRCL